MTWFSCLRSTLMIVVFGHFVCNAADIHIKWTLSNANGSIEIPIANDQPRDAFLIVASHLGIDPFFNDGDDTLRWIGVDEPFWTFKGSFHLNKSNGGRIKLSWSYVDTVAKLSLNDKVSWSMANMFTETADLDVSDWCIDSTNTISLKIHSPVQTALRNAKQYEQQFGYAVPPVNAYVNDGTGHINMLRKMQSSFGWDFGPSFPTLGFKNITISQDDNGNYCIIGSVRSTYPKVNGNGNEKIIYRMANKENKFSFYAGVSVYCHGTARQVLKAQLEIKWKKQYKLTSGNQMVEIAFDLSLTDSDLWFPYGHGQQKLFEFKMQISGSSETKVIPVGFRHVELIESDVDDNPEHGYSFYFKVNGRRVFLKGSNWVPRTPFNDAIGCQGVRPYFEAMRAAHFNALRVWGGGFYEEDCFYDLADRYGIMIWHDLMFACNLYPKNLDSVVDEVSQQLARLKRHPSILLFAGNNEVSIAISEDWYNGTTEFNRDDYYRLFNQTIAGVIEAGSVADHTIYLMTSPSNGRKSCSEDSQCISPDPTSEWYGDVHHYNYTRDPWDWKSYPIPRCATEFGVQSLPTLATLATALPKDQLFYNSPALLHRQHRLGGIMGMQEMEGLIRRRLRLPSNTSDLSLANAVYASQLVQAMAMRTEVEHYRRFQDRLLTDGRGLTSCALYWQLNDVWQAPSWSSIDHGGRWKMLHYHATEFFAPVALSTAMIDASNAVKVWAHVETEQLNGTTVVLTADFMQFTDLQVKRSISTTFQLELGSNLIDEISLSDLPDSTNPLPPQNLIGGISPSDVPDSTNPLPPRNLIGGIPHSTELIRLTLTDPVSGELLAPEFVHYVVNLKDVDPVKLKAPKISSVVHMSNGNSEIRIQTTGVAPFVWLESDCDGVFSRNAFTLTRSESAVNFTAGIRMTKECRHPKFELRSLYDLYV